MNEVSIEKVGDWLGTTADPEAATFTSLVIWAADIPLTEVHDSLSQSTRPSIRVPAVRVARWLLTEWWRLRWEARPERVTPDWRMAHSMAGLGGGYAWPDLEITSDGENVQLTIVGERTADAAAIRYLQRATIEVSATAWEAAIDRFVDSVETRLGDVLPGAQQIAELRAELRAERDDPALALRCRREARAGYEPGDAPADWHDLVDRLVAASGPASAEEILAVCHDGASGLRLVDQLRTSTETVDLSPLAAIDAAAIGRPWERGEATARRVREVLSVGEGPLSNKRLAEIVGHKLPFTGASVSRDSDVVGAYRAKGAGGTAGVRLGTKRTDNQRFALGRIMGMATILPQAERALALTPVKSAVQKFSRAFSQELLCPWAELDAFTDKHGTGETAVSRVASLYEVSERAITTALVNHKKVERDRLAAFAS